jgi:hypothetical protein
VIHIPVIPSEKLAVLCRVFFQHPTAQAFLNHEAAVHACDPAAMGNRWITTHMSTWQQHTDELTHNNIVLQTWEMPNMYLTGHEHVFKAQFQLLPKWACEAQRILDAAVAKTFPSITDSKSFSGVVNVVSMHVRRTDYLSKLDRDRRRPSVSGRFLMELIDRGSQGILDLGAKTVSDPLLSIGVYLYIFSWNPFAI